MNIEIGSYEAKTRLPELLRGVQAGNHYTITLRGKAVANLVPAEHDWKADAESAVDEMLAFMLSQQSASAGALDLKALTEDGRS